MAGWEKINETSIRCVRVKSFSAEQAETRLFSTPAIFFHVSVSVSVFKNKLPNVQEVKQCVNNICRRCISHFLLLMVICSIPR